MPRKYKRKPGAQQRIIKYNQNTLEAALRDLENNAAGICRISRVYGISARTLRRRQQSRNTNIGCLGKRPVLGEENEKRLVAQIKDLEASGCIPDSKKIRNLAFQFAEKHQLKHNFNKDTEMAGVQWLHGFVERHHKLSSYREDQDTPTPVSRSPHASSDPNCLASACSQQSRESVALDFTLDFVSFDMDSDSAPSASFGKVEEDSEMSNDSPKREFRLQWTSDNTYKLIHLYEHDCRELWDVKNPLYKDRIARQSKMVYLANSFGTTAEEVSRKLHNLRSQFNKELRHIKRRQVASGGGADGSVLSVGSGESGWVYFEALSFLLREPEFDPLDNVDGVNLALAEFQANEEDEFRARAQDSTRDGRPRLRVAASAPPPLPPSAHPMMWPEQPAPRIRPGVNADECQIFGDFVASELRTLRSDESRKRLKRIIQKAILKIGEEEDVNIING